MANKVMLVIILDEKRIRHTASLTPSRARIEISGMIEAGGVWDFSDNNVAIFHPWHQAKEVRLYDADPPDTLSPQVPTYSSYWLLGNNAHGWQIACPLLVKIERMGGEVVMSESRFNVYGVGVNIDESVADFTSMLVDLFEELVASEDILSYHLRQQLEILRIILAPC